VAILVNRIYPGMMLMSISVDLASVEGIAATRYNLIYLAAIALIVSIGVKVTGSLLVGALVIIPPATARMISRICSAMALPVWPSVSSAASRASSCRA